MPRKSSSIVPTLRTCQIYGPQESWHQVGEGTFGEVFKAHDLETHEVVALKKIRMKNEKEGFPVTAIREIKLLRDLQHENVIDLREVVSSKEEDIGRKGDIYIVFEFMDHDLFGLEQTAKFNFTIPMVKCFSKQLLSGLHYCHKRNIMHRDIKGANLLINNSGVLKLGDFGLSRTFEAKVNMKYTNRVVTLWYRAPELLLGATQYGPEIDIWSAGCIIAELLLKKPIFPGSDSRDQMEKVFSICGSPTEQRWPGVTALPYYRQLNPEHCYPERLRQHLRSLSPDSSELLCSLLTLDPSKRQSAAKALDHDWFWKDPMPCDPGRLADYGYASSHEFATRQKRNERRNERHAATGENGDNKRQRR